MYIWSMVFSQHYPTAELDLRPVLLPMQQPEQVNTIEVIWSHGRRLGCTTWTSMGHGEPITLVLSMLIQTSFIFHTAPWVHLHRQDNPQQRCKQDGDMTSRIFRFSRFIQYNNNAIGDWTQLTLTNDSGGFFVDFTKRNKNWFSNHTCSCTHSCSYMTYTCSVQHHIQVLCSVSPRNTPWYTRNNVPPPHDYDSKYHRCVRFVVLPFLAPPST